MSNLKETLESQISHPLIERCVIDMTVNDLPFYGEFALFMSFYKSEDVPTCAVNVSSRGTPRFYWNKEFVEKQDQKSMNFLIIHEEMHLLLDHVQRSIGYDDRFSNIAEDMIINQIIWEDIIVNGTNDSRNKLKMPVDKYGNNIGVLIPRRYQGKDSFHELYKWVKEDYERWEAGEDIREEGEQTGILHGDYGKYARPINDGDGTIVEPEMYALHQRYKDVYNSKGQTLDTHINDDGDCADENVKRQVVDNIVTSIFNRGITQGDSIIETLRKLKENKKDYLKKIKRNITNEIMEGKKGKTITKPNRKQIQGIKGKKKYKQKINAILDSSGSMQGHFDKTLSFIFQSDISINLIQVDAEVQDVIEIKNKNELNKMDIKGLGGTIISPGLRLIANDSNLNKYNTVILTDGMTDELDVSGVKGNILIISHGQYCPIGHSNGKVNQILIEDE